MLTNWLEILPFIATILFPLILVLVPIKLGERLGITLKNRNKEVKDAPIGSLVGAALGLLAFMLGFTFQITANRFDARKQLLLDEVSTLKKTYWQALLLPDPLRSECRTLLEEYVDLRANLVLEPEELSKTLARAEEIQRDLWKVAVLLAEEDRSSEIYGMFTTSLNEVIELHGKRVVVGLQYRIPGLILWMLYLITFFSMMILGFHFGISGKSNMMIHFALALTFAAVMWLIFALDRPEYNIIKVDQTPMLILQQEMEANGS